MRTENTEIDAIYTNINTNGTYLILLVMAIFRLFSQIEEKLISHAWIITIFSKNSQIHNTQIVTNSKIHALHRTSHHYETFQKYTCKYQFPN
jgi:hypothetical protein